MDTQYYTTTASPVLTFEEYHDIPSEHITGQRSPFSQRARTLMDVDLKLIYRAIREAIQKDMRGDEDKRVYTVAYKIYDIKAIHHYYMGICETYFEVDRDTIEIIEVKDIDGGMHAGQLRRLKEYGERNNL